MAMMAFFRGEIVSGTFSLGFGWNFKGMEIVGEKSTASDFALFFSSLSSLIVLIDSQLSFQETYLNFKSSQLICSMSDQNFWVKFGVEGFWIIKSLS